MTRTKKGLADIRRDTYDNWQKAKNYVPNISTIVIVDMPDKSVLLKIGDGVSNVNDLPDILATSKAQDNTPSSTSTVEGNVLILK